MKIEKKLTLIAIILLILIVILTSFIGVFKIKNYKIENIIPNYLTSMEFNNSRKIIMEIDNTVESTSVYDSEGNEVEVEDGVEYLAEDGYTTVENKVNAEELLKEENYNLSKSIILQRLKSLNVGQYIVNENKQNGTIEIQIPENEDTENIITILTQKGNFEVTDEETNDVLLNKSHIANVSQVYYTQTDGSVLVALRIELNKEGKSIFSEMSNKYISTTEEVVDEETGETTENEKTSNVCVKIDDQDYLTYYFQKDVATGILKYLDAESGVITIPFGLSSETDEINKYSNNALDIKTLLDTANMPLTYENTNFEISPEINNINILVYIGIACLVALFVITIVKFKVKGLILAGVQLGYVALLLLVLRYTNVIISLEGMVGLIVCTILNFALCSKMIKNISEINTTLKNSILDLIPLFIMAVTFSFASLVNVASFGMITFWGMFVMYIYNVVITKFILKAIEK